MIRTILRKSFRRLSLYGLTKWIPSKTYIKLKYRLATGKKLNLASPKTFCEKLQWLKLYDHNPQYTRMAGKVEAKEYATEKLGEGHIIKTLGVWDNYDEIDFDNLPNQFVLKCSHDSGGFAIVKNKAEFDKEKFRNKFEKSLQKNYFYQGREWPYKNVKPQILAEEYMTDENKPEGAMEGLIDYKFYCFNGEPKFLYVCVADIKNNDKHGWLSFYNLDKTPAPFGRSDHKAYPYEIKWPEKFEEMIEAAKKLAEGTKFVRIDLYWLNDNIYFSECTFFPGGGLAPFEPQEWEEKIGSWIKIG